MSVALFDGFGPGWSERPFAESFRNQLAEAGAASTPPDDLLWLANFERCLAWTFIERRALAQ